MANDIEKEADDRRDRYRAIVGVVGTWAFATDDGNDGLSRTLEPDCHSIPETRHGDA